MATEFQEQSEVRGNWLSGLSGDSWRALFGSNLGWLFDGYETYAMVLTVVAVMQTLLPPKELPHLSLYQGLAVSATLLGWAAGGVIWGVVTDYIGRKNAMMGSIFVYAVFTGLTFFTHTWWQFALIRLLTGLGLGAEWGTGATLLSEKWPVRARAKGAAMLQGGFGVGFLIASLMWFLVQPIGPEAWRYMYLIGCVPAFLSLIYIHRNVPESDQWQQTNAERKQAVAKKRRGEALSTEEQHLARFTMVEVFGDSNIRKRLLAAIAVCFATTMGWWAVSTWIPAYVAATVNGADAAHWAAVTGILYNVGGIVAYMLFAVLADWWGRRVAAAIFFPASFLATLAVFLLPVGLHTRLILAAINGFFTMGQWSLYAILLPELFPTRVRASAAAFVFNAVRFVAFVGPLVAGYLIVRFHGIPHIASIIGTVYLVGLVAIWFLPETKGKPLPN